MNSSKEEYRQYLIEFMKNDPEAFIDFVEGNIQTIKNAIVLIDKMDLCTSKLRENRLKLKEIITQARREQHANT
ncbi:MAG: hypothetical protein GQ468_05270 [Candidatus Scalindua sp.]|nr:hypothetical protein [Candidatus Scalindua sp.]